jgi:hypothetical protein
MDLARQLRNKLGRSQIRYRQLRKLHLEPKKCLRGLIAQHPKKSATPPLETAE